MAIHQKEPYVKSHPFNIIRIESTKKKNIPKMRDTLHFSQSTRNIQPKKKKYAYREIEGIK